MSNILLIADFAHILSNHYFPFIVLVVAVGVNVTLSSVQIGNAEKTVAYCRIITQKKAVLGKFLRHFLVMNIHFIRLQSLFCGAFLASKRGLKPFSGNQRFVVVSWSPLHVNCPPSDGDHFVPVEVPAAFPSGLEMEEAQTLQYRLPKDAEADQKDTELVQIFHSYSP